jgi:superoxide reductase
VYHFYTPCYRLNDHKKEVLKMTRLRELYLCTVCGQVVEVVQKGNARLSCCGKLMEKQSEKSTELGHETHLPVIEQTPEGVRVRVGEKPHPMTPEHHIVWIEVLTDLSACRMDIPIDMEPSALFHTGGEEIILVRAYCSVHGLWGYEPAT